MPIIDTALLSAFVSAVVSALLWSLDRYVVEPRRKEKEQKELQKKTKNAWKNLLSSNLAILQDREKRWNKLGVDAGSLDCLAPNHSELVQKIIELRSQILELNIHIDTYNAIAVANPEIMRITPLGDEGKIIREKKEMMDSLGRLLDELRQKLQKPIDDALTSLEGALDKEEKR